MGSNFLGDVGGGVGRRASAIISAAEMMSREGENLTKGLNYRDRGEMLSVFLVLPTHGGEYSEDWNDETQVYIFEGHDSTTVESGKALDQLLMYESGKLTDNGKFFKQATAFKDGVRKEALQIQVYEKIDSGVWYDKGIFDLVDGKQVAQNGRKVCKFYLTPADAAFGPPDQERVISAAQKAQVWQVDKGRCSECGAQANLRFVIKGDGSVRLFCAPHSGEAGGGLLG